MKNFLNWEEIYATNKCVILWKRFIFRNNFPTNDKEMKGVNDDRLLPSFKRTTFYRLLKNSNLNWEKFTMNKYLWNVDQSRALEI